MQTRVQHIPDDQLKNNKCYQRHNQCRKAKSLADSLLVVGLGRTWKEMLYDFEFDFKIFNKLLKANTQPPYH